MRQNPRAFFISRRHGLLGLGVAFGLAVSGYAFQAYSCDPTPTPSPTPSPSPTPQPSPSPNPTPTPTPAPTPTPGGTAHPMGCAADEIFVEAQSWWVPTPDGVGGFRTGSDGKKGDNFGHVHVGLCFPHHKKIKGDLDLKVRSIMHDNPGHFTRITAEIRAGSNDKVGDPTARFSRTCPEGQTCTWWDTIRIPASMLKNDGWHQLRLQANVEENGKVGAEVMRTSTRLHWWADNGRPVAAFSANPGNESLFGSRGWYTNIGYTDAFMLNPPTSPVSGVWRPSVEMKAVDKPTTGWFAAIDTDFHNGNIGSPLCPGEVYNKGTLLPVCGKSSYKGTLNIDTTRLTNGWHRLIYKTDAFDSRTGSTSSGVQVMFFQVKN